MLARQALEDTVDSVCCAAGADMRRASMRSRLISLRFLTDDRFADLAGMTWAGLSRICHHHAFELTPTAGEVQHLLDRVTELLDQSTLTCRDRFPGQ